MLFLFVLWFHDISYGNYELLEIFRGFRVFEYALWQKTKTRKCRKSTEIFLNKKSPIVNGYYC